ncbi:MAG: hypothetical protein ACRD2L_12795 [Terriglobia bacterium]
MRAPVLAVVHPRAVQSRTAAPNEMHFQRQDLGRAVSRRFRRRTVCSSVFIGLAFWLCGGLTVTAQGKKSGSAAPLLYSGNESGAFRIYFSGAEIGQEKFQITESGQSVKASAETRLTIERDKEKVSFLIRPVLEFNRFFEPVSYEIVQESGLNKTKARVTFRGPMSDAVYENGKETDTRQIDLQKDVLVLDDNVFHQYIILAKRYDFARGGIQEFSAFVPQQFIAGGVSVSDKGMEAVQVLSQTLKLQHLLVDTGELQISLWLDDRHNLRKLAVPKSGVEVVRE